MRGRKLAVLTGAVLALAALLALAVSVRMNRGVRIPVLMYHHLAEESGGDYIISQAGFQRQMDLLESEGYQPISLQQLVDYVNGVGELPQRPVCITFDDGYESNYLLAYPILQEKQFPATIFAIGSMVGCQTYYKDTDIPIIPYLTVEEIQEMNESGLITIQSHTYDMHQLGEGEDGPEVRLDVRPLDGESTEHYRAAFVADLEQEQAVLQTAGISSIWAMAYPNGAHSTLTDQVVRESGIQVTFTTKFNARNRVKVGEPDSLYNLGRLNVSDQTTDQELLHYLNG